MLKKLRPLGCEIAENPEQPGSIRMGKCCEHNFATKEKNLAMSLLEWRRGSFYRFKSSVISALHGRASELEGPIALYNANGTQLCESTEEKGRVDRDYVKLYSSRGILFNKVCMFETFF